MQSSAAVDSAGSGVTPLAFGPFRLDPRNARLTEGTRELELPTRAFAWALFEFNFGIEVGQLMIVAVAISILYAVRRVDAYARWAITGGSLVAIVFGAAWFVERTTGMSLLNL